MQNPAASGPPGPSRPPGQPVIAKGPGVGPEPSLATPPKKEEPARLATGITGAASLLILVLQQTGVAGITIGEAVVYLTTLYATLNERTREKVTAQPKG